MGRAEEAADREFMEMMSTCVVIFRADIRTQCEVLESSKLLVTSFLE